MTTFTSDTAVAAARRRQAHDLADQGLTTRQIADRLGVSQPTISRDLRTPPTTVNQAKIEDGEGHTTGEPESGLDSRPVTRRRTVGGTLPPEVRPGGKTCECRACGQLFTTPGNFDRHQQDRRGEPSDEVRCYPPTSRGLVILRRASDGRPIWGLPRQP